MENLELFNRKGVIDVAIWERLAGLRISGEIHQVFYVILSKTYGYGFSKNSISNEEFVSLTGLGVTNVLRSLKKLQEMGIIIKEKKGKINYFTVVKNCQKWSKIIKFDNSALKNKENQKNNKKINENNIKKDVNIIKNDNVSVNEEIIKIDNCLEDSKNNIKINNNLKVDEEIIKIDNNAKSYSNLNQFCEDYEQSKKRYYNNINIINNNNLEINKKNSLLNSKSPSKRLLGFFCALFFQKYNIQFKCNYAKDIAICNRIFANYGELKACYIIKEFFKLVADPANWQYQKVSLEVLEFSCNKICLDAIAKKKQQEEEKQIKAVEKEQIKIEEKNISEVKRVDINFNVMMTYLKERYGIVDAYNHINDYKTEWYKNLSKIIYILSTRI